MSIITGLEGVTLEECKRHLPSTHQLPPMQSTLDKQKLNNTGLKRQSVFDQS